MSNGWQWLIEEPYRTASVLIAGDNFGIWLSPFSSMSVQYFIKHLARMWIIARTCAATLGFKSRPARERMLNLRFCGETKALGAEWSGHPMHHCTKLCGYFLQQANLAALLLVALVRSVTRVSNGLTNTSLCSTHNIVRKSATCDMLKQRM